MALIIKPLTSTPLSNIHTAFNNAFSDYSVSLDMPFERFETYMIKRRDVSLDISFGLFDEQSLVGLMLNGLRKWHGQMTAYDAGTGLTKDYRGQGWATKMFDAAMPVLKQKNIHAYLLEVITTNTSAVNLYKKLGFKITRDFSCFKATSQIELAMSVIPCEIIDVEKPDWQTYPSFWDCEPSWQNHIAAVEAVPHCFKICEARFDGQCVGYGIIDVKLGNIPQLAVHKNFRQQKIGSHIAAHLQGLCLPNPLSVTNVGKDDKTSMSFWKKMKLSPFVEQHEMLLKMNH